MADDDTTQRMAIFTNRVIEPGAQKEPGPKGLAIVADREKETRVVLALTTRHSTPPMAKQRSRIDDVEIWQ
jgi:hypothetical protein